MGIPFCKKKTKNEKIIRRETGTVIVIYEIFLKTGKTKFFYSHEM